MKNLEEFLKIHQRESEMYAGFLVDQRQQCYRHIFMDTSINRTAQSWELATKKIIGNDYSIPSEQELRLLALHCQSELFSKKINEMAFWLRDEVNQKQASAMRVMRHNQYIRAYKYIHHKVGRLPILKIRQIVVPVLKKNEFSLHVMHAASLMSANGKFRHIFIKKQIESGNATWDEAKEPSFAGELPCQLPSAQEMQALFANIPELLSPELHYWTCDTSPESNENTSVSSEEIGFMMSSVALKYCHVHISTGDCIPDPFLPVI